MVIAETQQAEISLELTCAVACISCQRCVAPLWCLEEKDENALAREEDFDHNIFEECFWGSNMLHRSL